MKLAGSIRSAQSVRNVPLGIESAPLKLNGPIQPVAGRAGGRWWWGVAVGGNSFQPTYPGRFGNVPIAIDAGH